MRVIEKNPTTPEISAPTVNTDAELDGINADAKSTLKAELGALGVVNVLSIFTQAPNTTLLE